MRRRRWRRCSAVRADRKAFRRILNRKGGDPPSRRQGRFKSLFATEISFGTRFRRRHVLGGLCYASSVKKGFLVIVVFAAPLLFAQGDDARALPNDPKALLQMMAPYYDYASSDMKPWHIRYRYQYLDENGFPGPEGHFDYWWSTRKVSRASWTRGDQSHIEWHTADGKELRTITGNDIASMEHRLYIALLPSFWKMDDSASGDRELKYFRSEYLSKQLACVGSVRLSRDETRADSLESVWPAYCFDDNGPVLVASHENGSITNSYGQVQRFQNHDFPGQIEISYLGKKRIEAQLEDLKEVDAGDVAFAPSAEAREYVPQTTTTIVQALPLTPLHLKHRVDPVYPQSARAAHITGTVVVAATIDRNGRVKDAKIVSSPDVSLSEAALDAVRQWRYDPVTLNGQPFEMHTQIRLEFAL